MGSWLHIASYALVVSCKCFFSDGTNPTAWTRPIETHKTDIERRKNPGLFRSSFGSSISEPLWRIKYNKHCCDDGIQIKCNKMQWFKFDRFRKPTAKYCSICFALDVLKNKYEQSFPEKVYCKVVTMNGIWMESSLFVSWWSFIFNQP